MRSVPALSVGLLASLCSLSLVSQPVAAHSAPSANAPASVNRLDSCPVAGVSEFADSWGDPRSSGRRHEGVDMAADRGTPVVAVRAGEAEFKRSNLGGNAIWLTSSSGERFYYAHLDSWEGESRRVRAGEVIGYVGQSGNARGDHLHFEARAGDAAVNPYPLVRSSCIPPFAAAQLPQLMPHTFLR